MDLGEQVALLERILGRLGVRIRPEPLGDEARLAGGLCRLRGELVLFLDPERRVSDRRSVLLDALASFDTEDLWLPPVLREALSDRSASHAQGDHE